MNPKSDVKQIQDLVKRIKKGDRNAETALYNMLCDRLYFFACRKINEEEAKDICQDTLIAVLEMARNGKVKSSLVALSYRICNNKIADWYHNNTTNIQSGEFPETADPDDQILEKLVNEEDRELVAREMNKLPEKKRKVLYFTFFKKLDSKQIAKLMNLTPEAVRKISERALKELRRQIC